MDIFARRVGQVLAHTKKLKSARETGELETEGENAKKPLIVKKLKSARQTGELETEGENAKKNTFWTNFCILF